MKDASHQSPPVRADSENLQRAVRDLNRRRAFARQPSRSFERDAVVRTYRARKGGLFEVGQVARQEAAAIRC